MIDRLSAYPADFVEVKVFYEVTFALLRYTIQMEFAAEWDGSFPDRRICDFGEQDNPIYWVIEAKDKNLAEGMRNA
jgi:hypothetical protein